MGIIIKELMGWLVDPDTPINSTLTISQIEQLPFYSTLPENNRMLVIGRVISQLQAQGKVTSDGYTVTKIDFIDCSNY